MQDVTPIPDLMRSYEEQVFGQSTDDECRAMKRDAALTELKYDMLLRLGLRDDQTSQLDQYVTNNLQRVRRAMTLLVLYLWFVDNDQGEGSMNRSKRDHYGSIYKQSIAGMVTAGGPIGNTIILSR